MSIEIRKWQDLAASERNALLQRPAINDDTGIRDTVTDIIREVRKRGDEALAEFSRRFDRAAICEIRVSEDEFLAAEAATSDAERHAIDLAIGNVRRFHEAQLPAAIDLETMPGVRCERVSHAIDSVGLYVPAGTAPLPSAAIMLAVPAAIAGCPTRIMCTPPRPDGTADPAVLVAARRAGITEVFKVGGAHAIAAMAYGTATISAVDKIFGPGNAWVTEAKAQVSADPQGAAIDMPAGPSEVLVIGDENANAEFVAADLLSQAEHGPDSQVFLLTTSAKLATAVRDEIDRQLVLLSRKGIAERAIANSRLVVTDSVETAIAISNRYAPEHLILHLDDAREYLPRIRNAGSIFVGGLTPESAGDYCSGTNHVLPTYGMARSYSGLSVDQFLRYMTVQEITPAGLQGLGAAIVTLAGMEGLDGHAAAVERRLRYLEAGK